MRHRQYTLFSAIDIIFRHMNVTVKLVIGVVLILISFLLIAIPIEEIIQKRFRKNKVADNPVQEPEINSVASVDSSDNTSSTLPAKELYDAYNSAESVQKNKYMKEIL